MLYQDKKIKAIVRLTLIAIVLSLLLVLSLTFPDRTRALVQLSPLSRHGDGYGNWLAVLAVMVPLCWAVDLGLIFTSPEQEVRFAKWSRRWRKNPTAFEEIEFDTADPNYRKTAWRYYLDRTKR